MQVHKSDESWLNFYLFIIVIIFFCVAGNNHDGEDTSEHNTAPASPKYTTSEKWIADCQKRKVAAEYNWAVKKKKTEQRISVCAEKLKV